MSVVFIFSVKKGLYTNTCISVSKFRRPDKSTISQLDSQLPHGITTGNATIIPLCEESGIILMPERHEHLSDEPRQPGGCKLKTAPVRPVVAARPAEYVCSEDLFY
ncbi:hypothetical protein AF339_11780 [Salmonella enterica subsp. enterica serovar Typhimurium]|nr:hypothetical protein AF339_11780 [Salmonella enterica subsp. enterica serovar Typhimurium]